MSRSAPHRRDVLAASLSSAAVLATQSLVPAQEKTASIPLGFSLYGMKSLPVEEAIRICGEIGYDCVELPAMEGWPADGLKLGESALAKINDARLAAEISVSAIMENLVLAVDDATHKLNLARLAAAARVAKRLEAPLLETVLGGAPRQWESLKTTMAQRLRDWSKLAADNKVRIAIKAHVGGAAHLPEHLLWLLEQVESDVLCIVYDPSHFHLRGLTLAESSKPLAKHTQFVHVKDARGTPEKPEFLLPGEGHIDLVALLRLLLSHHYAGSVVVEVSGQISSRDGYNPIAIARNCFQTLRAAANEL